MFLQLTRIIINYQTIRTEHVSPSIHSNPRLILDNYTYTIQLECNKGDMENLKVEDIKVYRYVVKGTVEESNIEFHKLICLDELADIVSIKSTGDIQTLLFSLGSLLEAGELEKQKSDHQNELHEAESKLKALKIDELKTENEVKAKWIEDADLSVKIGIVPPPFSSCNKKLIKEIFLFEDGI